MYAVQMLSDAHTLPDAHSAIFLQHSATGAGGGVEHATCAEN